MFPFSRLREKVDAAQRRPDEGLHTVALTPHPPIAPRALGPSLSRLRERG